MTLTLADLYVGLGGRQSHPALAARSIRSFVIDSRQVRPGDCFIALAGERTDGHHYIGDAIQRGAVAILAERTPPDVQVQVVQPGRQPPPEEVTGPLLFQVEQSLAGLQRLARYWRARHQPTVIGITGSVGKTSTKELIAAVLRQRHATIWNEGNLNNEIGLPLTLLRLEAEHEYAVLEMGFYVEGEIAQLCDIAQPQIGIITNVGPIHLERAGSLEAIFRGKAELVRALPGHGHAILNWDDEWVRRMAPLSPAPVFRYGLSEEADLWADEIESYGLEGIRFRFHHATMPSAAHRPEAGTEVLHVHLPLLGRHSVHTALSAAAVGLLCGLAWEDIVRGLRDIHAQLRIAVTPGYKGCTLIDDTYNASPPSSIAALNLLEDMSGRRIAVLGDMLELGSYAETGHQLVGRRAAEVADILVTVGDLALWMAEAAVMGGLSPDRVHHVPGANEAATLLKTLIQPGDYVLVKGSRALGMESIVAALSRAVEPL